MKKNKLKMKKIIIILIVFLLSISKIICINAFEGDLSKFESETRDVDGVTVVVDKVGGTVINIIRIVSVTIALVMLLVIAMRYMISSPGDRADIKKHAVAYVIGAFILFGVTGILTILTNFADQIKLGS